MASLSLSLCSLKWPRSVQDNTVLYSILLFQTIGQRWPCFPCEDDWMSTKPISSPPPIASLAVQTGTWSLTSICLNEFDNWITQIPDTDDPRLAPRQTGRKKTRSDKRSIWHSKRIPKHLTSWNRQESTLCMTSLLFNLAHIPSVKWYLWVSVFWLITCT